MNSCPQRSSGSNHVVGYSASQNNVKYVDGANFTFGGK
jgi:hypothetical protein